MWEGYGTTRMMELLIIPLRFEMASSLIFPSFSFTIVFPFPVLGIFHLKPFFFFFALSATLQTVPVCYILVLQHSYN